MIGYAPPPEPGAASSICSKFINLGRTDVTPGAAGRFAARAMFSVVEMEA